MRNLTDRESQILNRMLNQLSGDQTTLVDQASMAKVDIIDEEGSLRFHLPTSVIPVDNITERVPVTASCEDCDGVPIYFLLHIVDGKLWELEVYKADGSQILNPPTADKLHF